MFKTSLSQPSRGRPRGPRSWRRRRRSGCRGLCAGSSRAWWASTRRRWRRTRCRHRRDTGAGSAGEPERLSGRRGRARLHAERVPRRLRLHTASAAGPAGPGRAGRRGRDRRLPEQRPARFANCFHLDTPQINAFGSGCPGQTAATGGEATLDLEVLDAAAPDLSRSTSTRRARCGRRAQGDSPAIGEPGPSSQQVISVSLGLCESNTMAGVGQGRDQRRWRQRSSLRPLRASACSGPAVIFGSADCAVTGSEPAQADTRSWR